MGGRGEGLTSSVAAVGAAEEASDELMPLGVTVGADEADDDVDDEVGFKEYDRSLSGRLKLVFVSGSGSALCKGGASCT